MTYGLEGRCSIQLSYWRVRLSPIGTARFELATPRSQSECSTGLSHVPRRKPSYRNFPDGSRARRSVGRAARTAAARWLSAFFRSGESSAMDASSAGTKKSGS
jgi:hypothetical protein